MAKFKKGDKVRYCNMTWVVDTANDHYVLTRYNCGGSPDVMHVEFERDELFERVEIIDIISYTTFKKREKPTIYEVRDGGGKGWCCETVQPTMHSAGWNDCIQEYNYGLFDNEKPKDMAIRLLKEGYGENWLKGKRFVYYPYYYHGDNNYMDALYVYWKEL